MIGVFYLIVFGIINTGLLYLLISQVLYAYDDNNQLIIKNVLIICLLVIIIGISYISALHVLFDKLLFLKFYQKPRYGIAIRRSIITMLTIVLLKLFDVFMIGSIDLKIIFILFMILIEVFYTLRLIRKEKKMLKDIPKQSKD